jgi:hypothetical protein
MIVRRNPEPGADAEIMDCGLPHRRKLSSIALLCRVIRNAKRGGASRIVFSDWLPAERVSTLRSVSRFLGFVSRCHHTSIYLKSDDDFFLEPDNLSLTPFFYGTF